MSSRYRSSRCLTALLALTALALCACEEEGERAGAHVARHVAHDVKRSAHAVALRMARTPDARCGRVDDDWRRHHLGPFATTLQVIFREVREATSTVSAVEMELLPAHVQQAAGADAEIYNQSVSIRRDRAGNTAFVESVSYAKDGLDGTTSRELRGVGETWYGREGALDFIEVHSARSAAEVAAVGASFDRLLALGGPLVETEPGRLTMANDDTKAESFACTTSASETPWSAAFGEDWSFESLAATIVRDGDGFPVERKATAVIAMTIRDTKTANETIHRVEVVLDEGTRRAGSNALVTAPSGLVALGAERPFDETRRLIGATYERALTPSWMR